MQRPSYAMFWCGFCLQGPGGGGGDCNNLGMGCSWEGSKLLPDPPALQCSLCWEQPLSPRYHVAARLASSSIILQRGASAPPSPPSGPREAFLVGKRGLCLELLTGSPGTVPWFWGTAPFILLFPEALDPGVERMCRAAGFEGNRLSAGRSFPSLCEPLGTFSLAQQRNRDLGLQERLFLQDLCSELASLQRQGCHERTAR